MLRSSQNQLRRRWAEELAAAGYVIRQATEANVEGIVALDRATMYLPHWTMADYVAIAALAAQPLGELSGVRRCLFIADDRGEIVGFAVGKTAGTEGDVTAELESVAVAISMRRAGVGRALCEAVLMWAQGLGAGEMELEVRSRSNGPIRLYEGLGFVAVGRRPRYYKDPEDDAILMRRVLNRPDARRG